MSIRNKAFTSIMVATILLATSLSAMEEKEITLKQEEQIAPLAMLPKDIKFVIITQLINISATLEEAVKAIRNLSQTSQDFRQLINDDANYYYINTNIQKLAQKFNVMGRPIIAAYLATTGSIQWLHKKPVRIKELKNKISGPDCSLCRAFLLLESKHPLQQVLRTVIKVLIKTKAVSVSFKSPLRGQSLILKALNLKDSDLIKFLVTEGAPITMKEANSMLHTAVKLNDEEMVTMSLKKGANVNSRSRKTNYTGELTPLYNATENRNLRIVKILLEYNANPNSDDSLWGFKPIDKADLPIARELLKAGALGPDKSKALKNQKAPFKSDLWKILINWSLYKENLQSIIIFLQKNNSKAARNLLLQNQKIWELILGTEDRDALLKLLEDGQVEVAIRIVAPYNSQAFKKDGDNKKSSKEDEEEDDDDTLENGEK